jgi:ABC-type polysaccharide/polyol phosphate transport system ATPase subunit
LTRDPSDLAIQIRHLSKKYPIYDKPSWKILEWLTLGKRRFHREFWALQDVDLEVPKGVTLGIIGQNGAGKSTLLQLIAGILQQTRGDCRVNGTVSSLLELGAGFNPEFTGRENILMNGAIMGLTRRQMEERIPEILAFAEIGDFVEQPVKTYSSGMFMRLAFSVAIHVDPDILLVDEALAVGDLIFQHRCISRIRRLRAAGKTILFVTHDPQALTRFCDRAILLDSGRKLEDGSPEKVAQRYQDLIFQRERRQAGTGDPWNATPDNSLPLVDTIPCIHHRYGRKGAEVIGVILHSMDGRVLNEVRAGEEVQLLISARFRQDIDHPIIGFTVRDALGVEITSSNTSYAGTRLPPGKAGRVFTAGFRFRPPQIRPGSYSISPAIASGNIWEHAIEDWIDNAYIFSIADTGLIYGQMKWEVEARYGVTD